MRQEPRFAASVSANPAASAGDNRECLVRDGLMTIAEAAAFLRVGRSTLYQLMDRGELPHVKIGSARRIPKRALIALAASNLRGEFSAKMDKSLSLGAQAKGGGNSEEQTRSG